MQLKEVSSKSDHKAWMSLPKILYKNDPLYIPHIKQDIEKVFDKSKNKAFRHGNIIRWFLVDDNQKPIGRIAAFVNKKMQNPAKFPVGGIGFFECINDFQSAKLLLDQGKKWLIDQGMEGMDGPINFGEKNQFWGLMIENFTDPPTYGMNYNPSYYKDLFENYGFKEYYQQLMFYRDTTRQAEEVFLRRSFTLEKDPDFECRNAKKMTIEEISQDFLTVYNSAWGGHQGFKTMRYAQAHKTILSMKPVMDRNLVIYAYYKDEPIGFYISIPELNQIFKYVNGNLNWWGKLIFLYHKIKGTPTTFYGLVFGVVKEWQGKGVEASIIKYAGDTLVVKGLYKDTILTWIGDFNPRMIKVCENLGTHIYRKFATYRYLFDRDKPFERHPIIGGKKTKTTAGE